MKLNTRAGFNNLLKKGSKHYAGLEEAMLKNIEACQKIAEIVKTSLGPNGMKKMIVNHLEKIFVTSDAATIMQEIEVQHPAAKMLVMASKMQERECGDCTSFVVALGGELLTQAEILIKMGLHPSQIIIGYEKATEKVQELLQAQEAFKIENIKDLDEVQRCLTACVGSKLLDYAPFFTKLIGDACIRCLPKSNPSKFTVTHVRVCKIKGGNPLNSFVMNGLIVLRDSEGSVKSCDKPKIAVFGCPLDTQQSDEKLHVVLNSAEELKNYTKGEEDHCEAVVKTFVDAGINVVIVGGVITEIMKHYLEKYGVMIIRIMSKWELRRLAKSLHARILTRLGAPTEEEAGECNSIAVEEVGSQKIIKLTTNSDDTNYSTIVLRGNTKNTLDDIERAIDDAVNVFACMAEDGRFVPGAGATEIRLVNGLEDELQQIKGLDRYAYQKFADAFKVIPTILSNNNGWDSNKVITSMIKANSVIGESGDSWKSTEDQFGLDINDGEVKNIKEIGVYDHLLSKQWGIKLTCEAVLTILRIDQIIIAKPAGGPKPRGQNPNWDDDD